MSTSRVLSSSNPQQPTGNRYTISRHQIGDETHYDLFLESDGVLKTWRLNAPPESGQDDPAHAVRAEQISDHRIEYLDYEGSISQNRGMVTIHSRGTYRVRANNHSPQQDFVILEGGSSAGKYRFEKTTLIKTA